MTTRYARPYRSDHTPNRVKAADNDQLDLGGNDGVLAVEHGCQWISDQTEYARFDGLRRSRPA